MGIVYHFYSFHEAILPKLTAINFYHENNYLYYFFAIL